MIGNQPIIAVHGVENFADAYITNQSYQTVSDHQPVK